MLRTQERIPLGGVLVPLPQLCAALHIRHHQCEGVASPWAASQRVSALYAPVSSAAALHQVCATWQDAVLVQHKSVPMSNAADFACLLVKMHVSVGQG